MSRYGGLTWDHPRGYAPLARAARDVPGLIAWHIQPLEGFESRSIEDICREYDVVVLDHPHLGDALAADALQPLDRLYPDGVLAAIGARTVGPCFDSYVMDGRCWALPLDAAAQVSAGRADLMAGEMPGHWEDMAYVSETEPGFTLSLGGPHAFLTLLSMCATADAAFGRVEEGMLQPQHDAMIELFVRLARRSHPIGVERNPIGILDAMAAGDGPTYCPLIFGYSSYATGTHGSLPIAFRDAPALRSGGYPRSVLGGTGIAITQRCAPDRDLLDHLAWLLSPDAQQGLIPRHSGQPSAETAWRSPRVNRASNGFYTNTLDTLRHAFVRPRSPCFVPAQNRVSAWLRTAVTLATPPASTVRAEVNALLAAELAARPDGLN